MEDAAFMRLAIAKAREGVDGGQSPFGAVVVRAGQVVVAAHNTVWRDTDPTAHAEVGAIRKAALLLGAIDLAGCEMFTTCEPCPMCLAAIHWSKIDRVVFGATIDDATAAGFSELHIAAREMVEKGGSPLRVEGGVLADECRALFAYWKQTGLGATY